VRCTLEKNSFIFFSIKVSVRCTSNLFQDDAH
jgi:hypothetical protein